MRFNPNTQREHQRWRQHDTPPAEEEEEEEDMLHELVVPCWAHGASEYMRYTWVA